MYHLSMIYCHSCYRTNVRNVGGIFIEQINENRSQMRIILLTNEFYKVNIRSNKRRTTNCSASQGREVTASQNRAVQPRRAERATVSEDRWYSLTEPSGTASQSRASDSERGPMVQSNRAERYSLAEPSERQ